MNLWAVQIKRKSHSKEVLSAKIVDVDTMDTTELGSDMLIPAIASGKFVINNLSLETGKNGKRVVLTNYIKSENPKRSGLYFYRVRQGDYLTESFIIILGGCEKVYDVVFDLPSKIRGSYRMFGTVEDIEHELDVRTECSWESYNTFNAIVDKDGVMWCRETDNGDFFPINFKNYSKIAQIRNSIPAEYCTLTYIGDKLAILRVSFDDENIEIPEGIEIFGFSHGGAYMVSMPKSLVKISDKAFKNDEDILQICINSEIKEIPTQMCIDSNLQYFEYTSKNVLDKVNQAAFYGCIDMKQSLILAVKEVDKFAFAYSGLKRISLPCCIKIAKKAFYLCDNLESARLQDVKIIESSAFEDCTKLTDVRIDSVKYIYKGAFAGCRKLKQVNVPKDAVVEDGAFHKNTIVNRI